FGTFSSFYCLQDSLFSWQSSQSLSSSIAPSAGSSARSGLLPRFLPWGAGSRSGGPMPASRAESVSVRAPQMRQRGTIGKGSVTSATAALMSARLKEPSNTGDLGESRGNMGQNNTFSRGRTAIHVCQETQLISLRREKRVEEDKDGKRRP